MGYKVSVDDRASCFIVICTEWNWDLRVHMPCALHRTSQAVLEWVAALPLTRPALYVGFVMERLKYP